MLGNFSCYGLDDDGSTSGSSRQLTGYDDDVVVPCNESAIGLTTDCTTGPSIIPKMTWKKLMEVLVEALVN